MILGLGYLLTSKGSFDYFKLSGIVTVNGVPTARKVRLLEFPSCRLIDQVWSDSSTGRYTFANITQRPNGGATYGVIAVDHTGQYDPEAKVKLIGEPM